MVHLVVLHLCIHDDIPNHRKVLIQVSLKYCLEFLLCYIKVCLYLHFTFSIRVELPEVIRYFVII